MKRRRIPCHNQMKLFKKSRQFLQLGLADEVAASASLLMGQAAEGSPIVLMRGVPEMQGEGRASDLVRSKEMDLFR